MSSNKTFQMECGHCRATFEASYKQHWNNKQRGTKAFCSKGCMFANLQKLFGKPKPQYGPCPTCNQMFTSRVKGKTFCSMKCYNASPGFKAMTRANHRKGNDTASAKALARSNKVIGNNTVTIKARYVKPVMCAHCKQDFYVSTAYGNRRRYCSDSCRRKHYNERFDRWIASPQTLALPQAYDEFLLQEDLPCLVDGCGWRGKMLALHMNTSHGIQARDFKRAAGFNLHTGIVAITTKEILEARSYSHLPTPPAGVYPAQFMDYNEQEREGKIKRYRSLEANEHATKARYIAGEFIVPPKRCCLNCGTEFDQTTIFGNTKYCSLTCRDDWYKKHPPTVKITCEGCGLETERPRRGKKRVPRFCGSRCRQKHNAGLRYKK